MVHRNNLDPVSHQEMGGVASSTGRPWHRISDTCWGDWSKGDRRGEWFLAPCIITNQDPRSDGFDGLHRVAALTNRIVMGGYIAPGTHPTPRIRGGRGSTSVGARGQGSLESCQRILGRCGGPGSKSLYADF